MIEKGSTYILGLIPLGLVFIILAMAGSPQISNRISKNLGLAHLDNISTIKYIKSQSPIFIFPIFSIVFQQKRGFPCCFPKCLPSSSPQKDMIFSLSQDLPRQRRRSDLRRGRPAEPRQHARRRRSDGRLGRRGRLRSAAATQGAAGAAFPRVLSRNQPSTLERCKDGGDLWGIVGEYRMEGFFFRCFFCFFLFSSLALWLFWLLWLLWLYHALPIYFSTYLSNLT